MALCLQSLASSLAASTSSHSTARNVRPQPHCCIPQFSGLGRASRLCLQRGEELVLSTVSNGSKVFAMRHGNHLPRLGRPADQRKALIRSLVTEVLRHGKITTTKVRAMAIRKWVDKMIGLGKDGSLHARRQALGFIFDKEIVNSLFEEAPARYGDRSGGYCRVKTEVKPRRGDNAEMAVIELV